MKHVLDGGLTFRAVEPYLRTECSGTLLAKNPTLLLDHPLVDLATAAAVPSFQFGGEVEDVPGELGILLRHRGLGHYTRQALSTELGGLARLLASLAIHRRLSVQLGVLDAEAVMDGLCRADAELVVLMQHLEPEPIRVGSFRARYRDALYEPERLVYDDARTALVAWGPCEYVATVVAEDLTSRDRAPCVTALLVSTRAGSPLGSRRGARRSEVSPLPGAALGRAPVVGVSAPFAPVEHPSLGLSSLRATIPALEIPILYLTIPFAETIGASLYDWVSNGAPHFKSLLGDWIFGCVLEPSRPQARYLEEVVCRETLDWLARDQDRERPSVLVDLRTVLDLKETVEAARESTLLWADEVLRFDPRVVAFTSVFQQHAASLALAQAIKTRRPDVVTLFGGSNCEGEMAPALVASYGFVDVAVSGEGEAVFPDLIDRLLAGRDVLDVQGVHTKGVRRDGGLYDSAPRPSIDDLPYPDYGDFFQQWDRSTLRGTIEPRLLFESSRGCWWGEKNHCTFCGLNGESMAFRSKRPERALEELERLSRRYPGYEIAAVDNILDMKYFGTLVRALAEREKKTALFYEVKANLTREQVALLKQAGIWHLQPGVESLSDPILRRMAKGVTALQNVQLIKWCTELGIVPYWNVLWGFPGETADDYNRMRQLIPLITHLAPPSGSGPIRLDRFSPNHFDAERLGFKNVKASTAYSFVYDLDPSELDRLAYFFDFDYIEERTTELEEAILGMWRELELWRAAHATSRLVHFRTDDALLVFDKRPSAVAPVHVLEGKERKVHELCDRVQSITKLAGAVGGESDAFRAVGRLRERGLLVEIDGRVLAPSVSGRTLAHERAGTSSPSGTGRLMHERSGHGEEEEVEEARG